MLVCLPVCLCRPHPVCFACELLGGAGKRSPSVSSLLICPLLPGCSLACAPRTLDASVYLFALSSLQPCLISQCAFSVYFGFSVIWDFPEFAHIQPAATWLGSSTLLMLFSLQDECPLLFFLLEVYSFFRIKLSSYTPPLFLVLSIVTSNGFTLFCVHSLV